MPSSFLYDLWRTFFPAYLSLAIFTGDVSDDLPKETFYSSVRGFHYDIKQVCEWLNYIIKNKGLA